MIIDKRSEFSDAHALTATGNGQFEIDLKNEQPQIGPGAVIFWVVHLDAEAEGGAGQTYSAALQTDSDPAFSSPTDIATIPVPGGAPAGTRYVVGFPYQNERYLRVRLNLGGANPSFTYSSWLTSEPPTAWQAYPDGIPEGF